MPNVDHTDLPLIGEKLVSMIRRNGLIPGQPGAKFTVSIGLSRSTINMDANAIESLLKEADQALYQAKNGGRDQYRIFAE